MRRSTVGKIGVIALPVVIVITATIWQNSRPVIERLKDPKHRLRAFYQEYSKTTDPKKLPTFHKFEYDQNAVHLLKIPVKGEPTRPIYIIHRDTDAFDTALRLPGGYSPPPWTSIDSIASFSSWQHWRKFSRVPIAIPEIENPEPSPFTTKNILSLFSHEGVLLDEESPRPFGGNNVTEFGEVIYDINADGWVERITEGNFKVGDSYDYGTLVTVYRLNRTTDRVFSVLTNIDAEKSMVSPWAVSVDWGYRCEDVDSDGTLEIQIGPKSKISPKFKMAGFVVPHINPEVTFFWNEKTQTFESPSGKIGPHFIVLENQSDWDSLEEKATAGKLRYPFDK